MSGSPLRTKTPFPLPSSFSEDEINLKLNKKKPFVIGVAGGSSSVII